MFQALGQALGRHRVSFQKSNKCIFWPVSSNYDLHQSATCKQYQSCLPCTERSVLSARRGRLILAEHALSSATRFALTNPSPTHALPTRPVRADTARPSLICGLVILLHTFCSEQSVPKNLDLSLDDEMCSRCSMVRWPVPGILKGRQQFG